MYRKRRFDSFCLYFIYLNYTHCAQFACSLQLQFAHVSLSAWFITLGQYSFAILDIKLPLMWDIVPSQFNTVLLRVDISTNADENGRALSRSMTKLRPQAFFVAVNFHPREPSGLQPIQPCTRHVKPSGRICRPRQVHFSNINNLN
jgi:hypothetical protein